MEPSAGTTGKRTIVAGKKRGVAKKILLIFAVFLVAVLLFFAISPLPAAYTMRLMFKKSMAVAPDNYEEMVEQVTVVKDVAYPSAYQSNSADIYYPKGSNEPLPVVLWVHGGAFVGGDKRDIEIYATALAYEGFAVVCINYHLAPEGKYPAPIMQTGEAYLWLLDMAKQYPLDMERFVLAGDSAGAHIAAQFAAIQCSSEYAAEMEITQTVAPGTIRSILLFCGPFDVAQISAGSNAVIKFLMDRAAWAYFGRRDWAEHFSAQATIAAHIMDDFPPTFISDGNTGSFEEHARSLAVALAENNVPIETYFINPSAEIAQHEYQFIMNTAAGKESFKKVLDFLRIYTSN